MSRRWDSVVQTSMGFFYAMGVFRLAAVAFGKNNVEVKGLVGHRITVPPASPVYLFLLLSRIFAYSAV